MYYCHSLLSSYLQNVKIFFREDQEVSQQMSDISLDKPATSKPEDSFVILESVSNSKHSSSGLFSNPLENMSEPMNFGSMRVDASSVSDTIFDNVNAFDGISKSVPLSQQVQSTKSFDLQNSVGRNGIQNMDTYGKNAMVDQSPASNEPIETRDDIWLTVSEIPLQTQPTSAPPPSRSPPPLVIKKAPLGADTKRKENESFQHFPQSHPYNKKSTKPASVDELEDFAMGKPKTYTQHHEDFFFNEEELQKKIVAEAAMKEAMHRAEARFKHAKEARGIDRGAKVPRNEEYINEKANLDGEDLEDMERQEGSDHERTVKEREAKEEENRLEKEREQEADREREKARQAAARAIREARERAAAEARLKAERTAAETRQRAERAAVQRAAAEARERAAAVARERAEKAAVEVREKAAAEAREKAAAEAKERERAAAEVREKAAAEAREKTATARERAAAEAREKAAAEARAAVERAAAEARVRAQRAAVERAAAEARERAAAAARESLDFQETMFDVKDQNKGSSDGTRRTSSGSSSTIRKASSTTNIVGDLTSIFGVNMDLFFGLIGLYVQAKALAEKNERDMQIQREQAERHVSFNHHLFYANTICSFQRIAEALDIEIKRWAAGKEGNLRALLSTLQYV
ncbi:hypothetical protein B296_00017158, partial [Ensete ventricosum]